MLTASAHHATCQPLPLKAITLQPGFWQQRQTLNRTITLPHGYRMLEESGTLNNFRLAAGAGSGEFKGWVFQDSDVYKWIEAVALEIANDPNADLESYLDQLIPLLAAAQQPDGYLNSHFTVAKPGQRWTDLEWAHELYCAGHLIEAAIAHHRATGQDSLLTIARRFADHIETVFGPDKRAGTCGHPEIELALVELYRETKEQRYLDLATYLINQRGHNDVKGLRGIGPAYMQERVPLREMTQVEGHAVRQLYLNSGATDLYLETGDAALLDTLQRLWLDMTTHKMYLTGGYGSRSYGESFGEAYDLPSKEAYCETCAAIAAMMWNWRMLLATGEARFADSFERSLYNGFLSGGSLSGDRFYYENPLRSDGGYERQPWFSCACCPPNLMRFMAMMQDYLATTTEDGIQIHLYASVRMKTPAAVLQMETNYPWNGRIKVRVESQVRNRWRLGLRIPGWCAGANARIGDDSFAGEPGRYLTLDRVWQPGDEIDLNLPMLPRLTEPHPHVDAVRGCLAIERGPLVYCLEGVDQESNVNLSDVRIDPAIPLQANWQSDLLGGVITIEAQGTVMDMADWSEHLYHQSPSTSTGHSTTLTAVPYYAWANRGAGPMRVWIPTL